jgi:hypothetical protein
MNMNLRYTRASRMVVGKGKTEGGHRRGHSNMAYWGTHEEAKEDSRIRRRIAGRRLEQQAAKKLSADAAEPAAEPPLAG